ncbi:MAG TPA: hypothetical protein VKZ18_19950 [Polyangia bacterium]|nr:hypothetical protein [Polyangia bacterium]
MRTLLEFTVTGAALAATVGLLAAAGCARPDTGAVSATEQRQSALTSTVRIAGHLANAGNVSVAGVPIVLAGSQQAVAITDAEGDFMFTVPAGSYALRPTRTGAAFTPDVVNLNNLGADAFQAFTCTAGCDVPSSIVPGKELVITDLSVVTDARTTDAADGPWSFRGLVEQMAPLGMDPADFMEAWINQFRSPPPPNGTLVNGFPVDNRDADVLRLMWPKRADGKVDPANTPFRLRAIVNRADMHASTNGEVRFVFGVVDAADPFQLQQSMAIIFEYDLPAVDPTTGAALTRQSWVAKFDALDAKTFGVDYNPALQAVTDLFTRRGTGPGRPNGSSLINLRSNEVMMDPNPCECFGKWQLRVFRLVDGGTLQLSTTPQNPDDTAHDVTTAANATLTSYLDTTGVPIRAGFATVPAATIGGQATAALSWNTFSAPVDPVVRHAFAGQTCGGCHLTEINGQNVDDLFHVSGFTNFDGTSRLSAFETNVEIPRRAIFAQHQLACAGAACAVGAEAILH